LVGYILYAGYLAEGVTHDFLFIPEPCLKRCDLGSPISRCNWAQSSVGYLKGMVKVKGSKKYYIFFKLFILS
jgi:hypothetical protein